MELFEQMKVLLDLGLTGILLYGIIVVWREKKETEEKKDNTIADKDIQIRTLNKEVRDAFVAETSAKVAQSIALKELADSNKELKRFLSETVYIAYNKKDVKS